MILLEQEKKHIIISAEAIVLLDKLHSWAMCGSSWRKFCFAQYFIIEKKIILSTQNIFLLFGLGFNYIFIYILKTTKNTIILFNHHIRNIKISKNLQKQLKRI